jgi:hypothetical protein
MRVAELATCQERCRQLEHRAAREAEAARSSQRAAGDAALLAEGRAAAAAELEAERVELLRHVELYRRRLAERCAHVCSCVLISSHLIF